MKAEQLKELGFNLVKEYVHGDNDEFVTRSFNKKNLNLDLDFEKKTGKYIGNDVSIEIDEVANISLEELKQLDTILNK